MLGFPKVAEARKAARAHWENPEKVEAKEAIGAFKEIATDWLQRHVDTKGLRSAKEIKRILDVYVYPRWGSTRLPDIRRRQVNELDYVEGNHGRSQADAVLLVIRGIMSWYITRDDEYSSPIDSGHAPAQG